MSILTIIVAPPNRFYQDLIQSFLDPVLLIDSDDGETQIIKPDIIPDKLWAIFPPNGQYIRHLCEMSGYQSRSAIIKLKDEKY